MQTKHPGIKCQKSKSPDDDYKNRSTIDAGGRNYQILALLMLNTTKYINYDIPLASDDGLIDWEMEFLP